LSAALAIYIAQQEKKCGIDDFHIPSDQQEMTSEIRGGMSIPKPTYSFGIEEAPTLSSFTEIHRYHPGLGYLYDISGTIQDKIRMDTQYSISKIEPSEDEPKIMKLFVLKKTEKDPIPCKAYMKVTHLLDPITWIRGKYEVGEEGFTTFSEDALRSAKVYKKLTNPMNQAYVEAVATYCLSKLREADVSPHFHMFYGAYRAIANEYSYNISDVFSTYRHCRWFWDNQKSGIFEVGVAEEIDDELYDVLMDPPSELHSEVSSIAEGDEDDDEEDVEELGGEEESAVVQQVELQSLHSTSMSSVEIKSQSQDSNGDNDEEYNEDDEDEELDEINVLAKIKKFPVMMLFTEPSQGTMDDLLDDFEELNCLPGDKEWDEQWTAWIFQICAALSVVQSFFGFTHNDLHTNNIVWSKTNEKYFYYTNRDGTVWAVPTYGKVFRIIDFGRAIFWVNDKLFYSDDFQQGNDAAEQFSFGPLRHGDSEDPEVYPNPSFDLCRLAVSLFEGLFPVKPDALKKGAILSDEPGMKVKETKSNLYNLLWSWMIDDDGRNVLMDPDGRERYPDFDLYKIITQKVHNAVPKEQILRPIFHKYRVAREKVPAKGRVYNLFF
jgi:hypothetical protein